MDEYQEELLEFQAYELELEQLFQGNKRGLDL